MRPNREPAPLPLVFRPAPAVRWVSILSSGLCAAVFAGHMRLAMLLRSPAHLLLALPLVPFILLGAWLFRRTIVVREEGLAVTALVSSRSIPWSSLLAVEQTRRGFVIITEYGDISTSPVARDRRDLLFRKVLELARLSLEPKEQRWGILARYVRQGPPDLVRPDDLVRVRTRLQP